MHDRRLDADLGMHRAITRRDLLQGVLATGAAFRMRGAVANVDADYPPALMGLRGSHVGSFEAAHALARKHRRFPDTAPMSDAPYDLVVVGSGISGLAAAYFYRERYSAPRILLLDNHDDFGGHAKRNEFTVGGKQLIGYGGSQSIDGPAHYSTVAKGLLKSLGIDTEQFYRDFAQNFYGSFGMTRGVALNAGPFPRRAVVPVNLTFDTPAAADLARLPLSERGRTDLQRLYSASDFLPGKSVAERLAVLRQTSYLEFLQQTVGVGTEAATLLKCLPNGLWGLNYDALSALEGYRLGQPGFAGLPFDAVDDPYPDDEPYIFHFPDGNASIARALVRSLIPDVAPGHTMDDLVTARFDYGRLDAADNRVRIRRSSTALHVAPGKDGCDVIYMHRGTLHRVHGRHCVLACNNNMIPYLLPSAPAEQRAALAQAVRTPLVYTNVVLRNWQPFVAAGVHQVYNPTGYYPSLMLDFPVSMGTYHFSRSPNDPIVVHLSRAPVPGDGSNCDDQFRAGRYELLGTDFETMERSTRRQLADMLDSYGFDPARDILGVTINRWPHGYAREYNELWDQGKVSAPPFWEIARQPIDGVTIANSDSQGIAYANSAIDAGYRAVSEL
jgi:spermidine dehydrogenase